MRWQRIPASGKKKKKRKGTGQFDRVTWVNLHAESADDPGILVNVSYTFYRMPHVDRQQVKR